MALVLQVIVTGLAAGAGYGLVALGTTLIYRLTGVVHLAIGELAGLAIFVALAMAAGTGPVTRTSVPVAQSLAGVVAGLAVAAVAGVAIYFLAVRPFLRRGLVLGWIGAVVGVAFAVRGLLGAAFVREAYVFPDPIPFDRVASGGVLSLGGGVTLPVRAFFVAAIGGLLAWAAARFLGRSKTGLALRAIASEPEGAHLAGLPVDRLLAFAFALAGVLAATAGIVAAPSGPVSADTGVLLGLKGLAAALVGGFRSPPRAFAAGLALGVLETSVAAFHVGGIRLGTGYRDVVPLLVAVAVMAFRRIGVREPAR